MFTFESCLFFAEYTDPNTTMVKNIMVQLDLSEPDAVEMCDRIRLAFKKHDPPRLRKLPEVPKRLMEVSENTDSLYLCFFCFIIFQ